MKDKPWLITKSNPVKVFGFFTSLKKDLFSHRGIYEYIESVFRETPGYLGRYFRYRIVSHFFAAAGKSIMIDPGNRFKFPYKIRLGDNVGIASGCMFQAGGGIEIGENTIFGPGVKIWTVNHLFKDLEIPILQQGFEGKPVVIGADCWIGADSFIKPGTVIPEGCVVFPKSVVGKMFIKPYSVLSGNPAKVVGPRSRIGAFMGWGSGLKKEKEPDAG
ncbi:hypothetical protein B4O97_15905 [Marispirochaeta aestuarii]|uniref:Acetyltransferase n=1 Tax=Marispirochaeta aestuarii TaxID=1963862 RepID=A0A1Y1RUD7_9SPIO|nr:acyltransferase [Marispirochaeta aestuarii]ORC32642.1 hypothetical protein B4O97_15905 [Marispirochaeta aestuarii]